MEFDSADAAALDAAGTLDDVVLHEMGHVIGFGTLWNTVNLGFPGTQQVYTAGTGKYLGAFGNAAYVAEIEVRSRGANCDVPLSF